ncbi:MAG: branched-chain amino acid ABC transporter permease [Methanomicrobiales archaeon]|nr:branched-chain amino acid ABC transporter permease [Methanomicrobiales archaeon]MDI6877024.1 branched-chain amino acid ABC transporter permease [Methanomicrobiales archaeon]
MLERLRDPRWMRYAPHIAVATAIALPFLSGMNLYLMNVWILMLIFIIFASSWNLLAYSGQASLGHAAFFGIGGYVSTLVALNLGVSPYLSILVGGAVSAIVGVLLGLTCVRLKEWFLAMVTFGFAIIVQTLVVSVLAPVSGGWDGLSSPRLLASSVPGSALFEYYAILLVTIGSILLIHFIFRSRLGLAFAAIRENELEARVSGVDPVRYKLLAFAISAFLAGIAGALEIHHFGYVTPEIYGVDLSFWPVIYTIFGGLGTIAGPILGTVVITVLWDALKDLGLTYERYIVIGAVLVFSVIFLPKGLVSLPEAISAWRRRRRGRVRGDQMPR